MSRIPIIFEDKLVDSVDPGSVEWKSYLSLGNNATHADINRAVQGVVNSDRILPPAELAILFHAGVDSARMYIEEVADNHSQYDPEFKDDQEDIFRGASDTEEYLDHALPDFDDQLAGDIIEAYAEEISGYEHIVSEKLTANKYVLAIRRGASAATRLIEEAFFVNMGRGMISNATRQDTMRRIACNSLVLRMVRDKLIEQSSPGKAQYIRDLDGLLLEFDVMLSIYKNPNITRKQPSFLVPYARFSSLRQDTSPSISSDKKFDIEVIENFEGSSYQNNRQVTQVSVKKKSSLVWRGKNRIEIGQRGIALDTPKQERYVGDVCDEFLQKNGLGLPEAIRIAAKGLFIPIEVLQKVLPNIKRPEERNIIAIFVPSLATIASGVFMATGSEHTCATDKELAQ